MRVYGEALMRTVGKLAVVAFLFLLTGVALASAQSGSGIGTAEVDQEQEKLCLTCHSPRFPPNDASQDHWRYSWDVHAAGSPCYVCHGDTMIGFNDISDDTHNSGNVQHPTWEEAAAMGKSDLDCGACHYPHNITKELLAGSITNPSPAPEPLLTIWASMIGAGVSLITGVSVIAVLFSIRKRICANGGN